MKKSLCGSFIVKSSAVASQNKRASLILLSKEANTKDTQLKSQLLLSFQDDDQSKASENIWLQPGFFGEQRADLTIQKPNFPERTLTYVNQAHVCQGRRKSYLLRLCHSGSNYAFG